MATRADYGGEFERQFIASLPPRVTYARKLHGAGPVASFQGGGAAKGPTRFAPPSPYDFFLTAPAPGPLISLSWLHYDGQHYEVLIQPSIFFALELKSTAGKSLPHAKVKDHQVDGLLKAAAAGHPAGLVVEFREVGPAGEVWFVPIRPYAAYRTQELARSLPVDIARLVGTQIELDPERGRKHRYWCTVPWLRSCGAELPAGS